MPSHTNVPQKIMIIDDDVGVLVSAKRLLERRGYAVAIHEGGAGCVKEVSRFNPDLILVDVNMPVLTGDAFVSLFQPRSGVAHFSVVLYSGIDERALQEKAQKCGAQGYISKAESTPEFIRKIACFLRHDYAAAQGTTD